MKKEDVNLERRSFFSLISKSFLGVALLSSFPLSAFAKSKKNATSSEERVVEVKINPLAVKRMKK